MTYIYIYERVGITIINNPSVVYLYSALMLIVIVYSSVVIARSALSPRSFVFFKTRIIYLF